LRRSNICFKQAFVAQTEPIDTRQRLLEAATTLFAEYGFHRTTVRDIAELADVNLAAANYHFGSKRDLYLEVLRAGFAGIRAAIARRHADVPPRQALARLPRRKVEALLTARILTMFEMIVGPPPGLHARLMQREMTDPGEALPIIVDEFIRPMRGELMTLIAALEPTLDEASVERCANSVMGQAIFYRFCRPALLQMLGVDEFPRGIANVLAEHVAEFTIGGVDRRARARKGKTRAE
jgi:TetR/AcrR family transcriptional regulator, regulator of cefoperazone and chloramphenicol sensitivity